MNSRRLKNAWRFGLMLALLCTWSIPGLAIAGTAPPIPTGPFDANGNPSIPDYYTTANWANSPPLAKFVDTLPGLGSGKANNLGQYLSVGKPDIVTYPGSDYYEIELVEYKERMHSDLPAPGTLLRGYVQVNKGTDTARCGGTAQPACTVADNTLTPDPVHQLGPTLVAQRDRPVRIKFTNKLPIGPSGDLFIPVDTSVMGAGKGPASASGTRGVGTPCDNTVEPNNCASYTQNRSAIHLHGGRTPWISDGTPHQWITPAGEITPFTKGVSFANVPDMPDPGDGSMTYYYTNQQSARLMFYHEHAFGITRLNPYVGVAAGYVITDTWEQDLVNRGLVPPDQIPLIIQDKTFVDATPTTKYLYNTTTKLFDIPVTVPQVRATDPLWNWGSGTPDASGVRPPVTGDLWLPHVYMPAQNSIAGSGGVNPFGRWMYGPWFYPATAVEKGPVANPYYDADCSSPFPTVYANCTTPGQPTQIPGTPHPSMGMEAFQDSAVVNGTAFPSLTVDPRAYRFRILNAASDRFWNLSFYVADSTQISPDPRAASPLTEVKMLPASADLAAQNNWPASWPVDGRDGGVPDPALRGPSFLQIGTEGGFLPQPVLINPQPITYNTDPTAFWVGNVDKMGLAIGPAERADVIVDFSAYAGQTLILYNDAPAAWPARVPGYDYYTGAPDMRDSGGYGTGGTFNAVTGFWDNGTGPLAGFAPNTRTVMQVIVTGGASGRPPVDAPFSFNQAALAAEFTSAAPATAINPAPVKTLFERAQEPIIVGQAAYATTYPNSYFPPNFPWEGVNQINDHFLQFVTLAGEPVRITTEPKGIHDEMGASFDPIYGRMSGNLGMQLPNPTTLNALLVLYGYSDVPTETINNSPTVNVQVLQGTPASIPWAVTDGTQIWKISHNGVDTHPIHFHIFDVQLINRVGWDGQILMPEPNELGWKDTIKISPLEDTIVAVRPRAPALPFGIANSLRPLNPAIPLDSPMGFNSIDWQTGQAYVAPSPWAGGVTNKLYDFGWEYVWHCHILSHEEMDMMRPIVLKVESNIPDAPVLSASSLPAQIDLSWTDSTPVNYVTGAGFGDPKGEIGFRIERAIGNGAFSVLGTALANSTTFNDFAVTANTAYSYRITAFNAAGDSASNVVTLGLPLIITTTSLPNGTVSAAYSRSLAATGGVAPLTWSATGLPAGLAMSTAGVISGRPTVSGVFTVTAQVTDSLGATTSKSLSLTVLVGPPLSITTTSLTNGVVGAAYARSLSASGGVVPYSWTATGLPAGLTISGAGLISGRPTAPGTFTVTAQVTDSQGTTASKNLSLTVVVGPLSITTTSLTNGVVGAAYARSLSATGGITPYSWTATGLPAGLTISGAGLISGRPTAPGTFTVTAQVTDSQGTTASKNLSLTVVVGPLSITTTSLTNATVAAFYSRPLSASGGIVPYSWTATGLPAGLTISGAGLISGRPTVPGTFTVTAQVTDSQGTTVSKNLSLTVVVGPLSITTTSLTNATVAAFYSRPLSASGGVAPYSWTATGLPAGLTINGAGLISGRPTVAGTFTVTAQVTDSLGTTVSKNLSLTVVVSPLSITTASLPNGTVGALYSRPLSASGGVVPYSWTATGLPAGLTISGAGVISGRPTAPGTFNVTLQVADNFGTTPALKTVTMVVN